MLNKNATIQCMEFITPNYLYQHFNCKLTLNETYYLNYIVNFRLSYWLPLVHCAIAPQKMLRKLVKHIE